MNPIRLALSLSLFAFSAGLAKPPEVITTEINVSASPMQSFNAFTLDPQILQWSGARDAVFLSSGGPWRIVYNDDHLEEGFVVAAAENDSVVYTILGADTQKVTIHFAPIESGTRIRVDQELAPGARNIKTQRKNVASQWQLKLALLSGYLNGCPGCYIASPKGPAPYAAVVVVHDAFGVNRTVRGMADSLANAGYYAVAVDLFKGETTSDPAEGERFLSLVNDSESVASVKRAIAYVRGLPETSDDQIAIWGVGYGGTIAMSALASDPELRAGVVWYDSELPEPAMQKRISRPVFAVFGDENTDKPRAEIDSFSQSLTQSGVRVETVVLAASPKFADPTYGTQYNDARAKEAYQRTLIFLNRNLTP